MAGSEVTIRVIASKPGYTNSQVVSATYTVTGRGGRRAYEWTVVSTPVMDEICKLGARSAFVVYTDVTQLQEGITLYIDSGLTTSANIDQFYLDISDPGNPIWFYDRNGIQDTRQTCI